MTAPASRNRLSLSAKLLIGLALIIAGAAAATWLLARYDRAAQVLGVAPPPPALVRSPLQLTPLLAWEDRVMRVVDRLCGAEAPPLTIAGLSCRCSALR